MSVRLARRVVTQTHTHSGIYDAKTITTAVDLGVKRVDYCKTGKNSGITEQEIYFLLANIICLTICVTGTTKGAVIIKVYQGGGGILRFRRTEILPPPLGAGALKSCPPPRGPCTEILPPPPYSLLANISYKYHIFESVISGNHSY